MAARTGLPVTRACFTPWLPPSKPKQTRSATGSRALFDSSRRASAFTSTKGLPSQLAIKPPGKQT
jgi:hypothetical protein